MNQYLYISILLIITTCCCLFISYLAWRKKELSIAKGLFLGMWAGAFYSFGYAFEILSSNLDQIQFWLRIQYIGISFGTLIWFVMVLQFTNNKIVQKKATVPLLSIVPFITLISFYTNNSHFLFYRSIAIDELEAFPLVSTVTGPFYHLHVIYSYLLFVVGMGLLINIYLRDNLHSKKQIALMMIGSCGPFGVTLLYLIGFLDTGIDYSPFGFLFLGVFYIWGIYQFNFLKLAPLALQKVFESMQDAVIVFDVEMNVTSFNQASRKIFFELIDRKMIGKPASSLFKNYPTLLKLIMQEPSAEQRVLLNKEEGQHYYVVRVSTIYNTRKKLVGKMLLLNDVTEAVRAEEKLQENARLLSELNSFKDRMFTIIAHDIRDPLAVLSNLMELHKEDIYTVSSSQKEVLNEMEQQIENTFKLTESLLDWFKGQKEGMRFEPIAINLFEIIQMNVHLLLVKSNSKKIDIESEIPHNLIVYADREMLNLIIRNLLSNAIKFTDIGGHIQINANQEKGKVRLSIIDTGIGIDPDYADSLLLKDYPVSLIGTSGERGAGLGLILCKEFVRINGGDIWFDSVLGQGSQFCFSIPTAN